MSKDYSSAMENPLGQCLRELPGPLLLTGHTGFKGTWMSFLLEHLGVPVVGYSLQPDRKSLFERADRKGAIPEVFDDVRNYEALERFIDSHKPSTIIHMAAQPLVLKSYETPHQTFEVNVMGTVNLLDIAQRKDYVKAIIVITTDKVYKNESMGRAFIETDALEGKDPYSASKVGSEAAVAAWQQLSRVNGGPAVVSARAGNVIGGGDFAENRIIPDLIRSLMSGDSVSIRNPESTRPWEHVLDPLVGYLMCLEEVIKGKTLVNLNFGPRDLEQSLTVSNLIEIGSEIFPKLRTLVNISSESDMNLEAELLRIDPTAARIELGFHPKWDSTESILLTFHWWKRLFSGLKNASQLCKDDINLYFSKPQPFKPNGFK
jgi:CDP-glucose 4,6-dehydratase